MIADSFINLFLGLGRFIVSLAPDLSSALNFPDLMDSSYFNIAKMLFEFVGYVLPVGTIVNIFIASILLGSSHILWAIVLRIKSFIPTMGA